MHFPFRRAKKKPKKTAAMDPDGDAAADSDGGACAQGPMFAMVCINNVNRSPAAHASLRAAGLRVCSFGAGRAVTFPGATAADSRVFKFRTPYETMQRILQAEDAATFSRNGVLGILERDVSVKRGPERWQSLTNKDLLAIDVVVCLDYAMFITVLEDIRMRIRLSFKPKQLHVLCLDTEDTPEDADSGGARALELCRQLNAPPEQLTEARVRRIIEQFEQRHALQMFYLGLHF